MEHNNLQNLASRIAEIEREAHPGRPARLAGPTGVELGGGSARVRLTHPTFAGPTGVEVLLGGQLGAGSLVELFSEEGAGTWTLALFMARHACGRRKILIVADGERRFYPPAASRLSIDLRRTLVIRPRRGQPALAAMTQALRCAAVGAAIGKLDRLTTLDCRRLQMAAESGGGIGLLLRSAAALSVPSFANIRLLVTPVRAAPEEAGAGAPARPARRIQVEVVRFRGGKSGQSLILEIDDDKGHVHVPASVVVAESPAPSARAQG
jgi:protein ImuA